MKYKLIKGYPGSQRVGYIFDEKEYPRSIFNKIMIKSIKDYPEYFKKINKII